MNLPFSPTVRRVVDAELCTGCGLCASLAEGAIRMETAEPGYSRPKQVGPVGGDAERAIAQTCPGLSVAPWPAAPSVDPYWGPWRQMSTGYSTDPELRHRGSSGGMITALAAYALRTDLVDRVVHVLADEKYPTRNRVVCSTSEAQLVEGAGSRYAASSPLSGIEALLSDGGKVAFIGKPCDVSALRRLAAVDPRVAEHVPIALSFFCAGVPSHRGADRVLASMGVDKEDIVAFRYRGNGWPGYAVATSRDGSESRMNYEDSWGGHLSKEVQFRCKICPDAVGGAADVACADAWFGDARGYPSFEEQDGRSLVAVRTEAGEDLVRRALADGAIQTAPLDVGLIEGMQPSQARRKRLVSSRMLALTATAQTTPKFEGVMISPAAARAPLVEKAKSFLGTVRRILAGRR